MPGGGAGGSRRQHPPFLPGRLLRRRGAGLPRRACGGPGPSLTSYESRYRRVRIPSDSDGCYPVFLCARVHIFVMPDSSLWFFSLSLFSSAQGLRTSSPGGFRLRSPRRTTRIANRRRGRRRRRRQKARERTKMLPRRRAKISTSRRAGARRRESRRRMVREVRGEVPAAVPRISSPDPFRLPSSSSSYPYGSSWRTRRAAAMDRR